MRNELIEKGSRFRELKTQYEAFVMEHHFVTDQVISSATTARLEEIDLGILHWEGLNQDEINAFGGMDIFTTPSSARRATINRSMACCRSGSLA